jgi:hypothetical protein
MASSAAGKRRKGARRSDEPPITGHDAISRNNSLMPNWRVSQLKRLGIPGPLAEIYADRIDWHQIARLVQRGCPPQLALRIVR